MFVIGCPRSGTTFLADAIGSCPGFVDLGEVAPFKAAMPRLVSLARRTRPRQIRRMLADTRRLGLVGDLRAVEQTPETAFVGPGSPSLFREATHRSHRAGRARRRLLPARAGWLSSGRSGADDAGLAYGRARASGSSPSDTPSSRGKRDAKRAAWAWRRYVQAAAAGSRARRRCATRSRHAACGRRGRAGAVLGDARRTISGGAGGVARGRRSADMRTS